MIINMADKLKDAEDLMLEALFATEAVPDDGFSVRIEKKIRRRILVQRFALPVAILLGGAIAAKPVIALLTAVMQLFVISPEGLSNYLGNLTSSSLPSLTLISFGAMIALALIMISRMLED
jgi:hypothetical protein